MLLTSVLCFGTVKCHMIGQIACDQITSGNNQSARDQIAFYSFRSFLV